jgi:hypothetical protein
VPRQNSGRSETSEINNIQEEQIAGVARENLIKGKELKN